MSFNVDRTRWSSTPGRPRTLLLLREAIYDSIVTHAAQGTIEEAAAALVERPTDCDLLVRLADYHRKRNLPREACDLYLRAVDEYMKNGAVLKALMFLSVVIGLEPNRTDTRRKLAEICRSVGDEKGASAHEEWIREQEK